MNFKLDRMGNVPWLYLPWVIPMWLIVTWFFYAAHTLLSLTVRAEFIGEEKLEKGKAYVFIGWHDSVIPYISCFWRFKRPYALLLNDAWYMYPICKIAKWIGVKALVYGMSGHQGRDAADQIEEYLSMGYSTMITPDGPRGPRHRLRRGALHISKNTNAPIVPTEIRCQKAIVLGYSWDKKRIPLPFSKVTIKYNTPIQITEKNIDELTPFIEASLGKYERY